MRAQLIKLKGQRLAARQSGLVFSTKLYKNSKTVWRGAIRSYITAIMDPSKVQFLNDTGMSRASLIGIAREVQLVGKVRVWVETGQQHASRKGSHDIDGNWNPDVPSTAALGERLGNESYKILYGSPQRPVFQFEHTIPVWQYKLYETDAPHGYSSYNSLEVGFEAFNEYMEQNIGTVIPRIAEFLDSHLSSTTLE